MKLKIKIKKGDISLQHTDHLYIKKSNLKRNSLIKVITLKIEQINTLE